MSAPTVRQALSPRELQILTAKANGATVDDIIAAFHLSRSTVKTHLIAIFQKLSARNGDHAVHLAHQRGLLGLGEQPMDNAYWRGVERMNRDQLIDEIRLARTQCEEAERARGKLAIQLAAASQLLTGLACIVRRLPRRPRIKPTSAEQDAIAWVESATYENSDYIPWHSDLPKWVQR